MTLREQLAEFDAPVKQILRHAIRRAPWALQEDALQEARIGYLAAIARHDPTGGNFDAYAYFCINGAVQMFLRSEDPLTQKHRRDVKAGLAEDPACNTPRKSEVLNSPSREPSPIDLALVAEIRRLVGFLDGQERGMIEKVYFEGKEKLEAGLELGITKKNAAWNVCAAALKKIRSAIMLPVQLPMAP